MRGGGRGGEGAAGGRALAGPQTGMNPRRETERKARRTFCPTVYCWGAVPGSTHAEHAHNAVNTSSADCMALKTRKFRGGVALCSLPSWAGEDVTVESQRGGQKRGLTS